jgi:hypothetical protein
VRDVEEKLDHLGFRAVEVLLEVDDRSDARLADGRVDEFPDANRDDILVMRPIEDPDLTGTGKGPVYPPKEVVAQLFFARPPERLHTNTLGIDPAEDASYRAVLSASVHRLKDD